MRWTELMRRAGMAALVAAATLTGGLVTAALWPVTVETGYYAADVRLAPGWGDRSRIGTDTVVGSVSARFSGLAPGVDVAPRVKPEITELVRSGDLDASALDVGPDERTRVIREAATGVGLRFAAGAALGLGVVLLGVGLRRRGLPSPRTAVGSLTVAALTCALSGVSAQRTYQADRLLALDSTGLLQLAIANRGLLDDVEQRADQATPYLRNLLALSAAMQDEYAPEEVPGGEALRVLLVSDIHSANQYALMRTIVQEQDVDVVIDSGDLINLGHVEEARLSNLYRSITSLGVPYVFVAGNHDRSSPSDTALLDELAGTQGVQLLEPGDGGYREVDIGGLRIAGFNDPRYYGDADDGTTDAQGAARDRWLEALGEQEPPDITVSHEAPALDDAPGRLRVHGHGHVPLLDGNRLQVGTFTGGGTLSHFVGGPDAELVGQPSSFDVLTFDSSCRAQRLVRYQYRSVIEGRPSFDSLSVLNASRIVDDPAEGRTCGGDELSVRPLRP
ncbi:metallophosphoesterase family protein [Janibacter terrae]|uniref:metallophosphoesterase family protein n=1 Tax=Janibacter terrae TaxID=103817 RepID=UPI0014787A81|nr:metallophosphoesterase [Janibacter terrae]